MGGQFNNSSAKEIEIKEVVVRLLVFIIILDGMTGCTNQHNSYEQYQFPEMGFCRGIDETRLPIDLTEAVVRDENELYLCIKVETDGQFTFRLDWFINDSFVEYFPVTVSESDGYQSSSLMIRTLSYQVIINLGYTFLEPGNL